MESQDNSPNMNYRSMIYRDSWHVIFYAITRLITIEDDLNGENVQALEGLINLAEEVRDKTLET